MDKSLHVYQERMAASHAAMTARDYQNVVKSSTEALHELMDNHIMQLLDLRSTANEKQGLLSRALDDAMQMIQNVPTSALGYLRTGSVYNTSGKPSSAVDSYKQGLETVPKLHSEYHQIQEEHDKAVLRTQSRFDIIGLLPLELLYKVLLYLDSESLWICLTVSSRWCYQATQCGSWWDSITVKETGAKLDQVVCDAIPFVKHQILSLELMSFSSASLNERYLRHLKSGAFTKIRTLSLKEGFCNSMEPEDFGIVLWQIRHTLTSLKLEFGENKSYRLLNVLAICPNVEELSYTTTDAISFEDEKDYHASRGSCKKLLKLELFYASTTYTDLCSHIALCPNLRRLTLNSSNGEPFNTCDNSAITDFCPKLKILGINCTEGLPDISSCKHLTDDNGVAYMAIRLTARQSAQHIHAQSQSIQRLNIVQAYDGFQHQYHGPYSAKTRSSTYPKLRSLKFISYTNSNDNYHQGGAYPSFAEHQMGMIILNSPNLADLSVQCFRASTFFRCILDEILKTRVKNLTLNTVLFPYTGEDWGNRFLSSLRQVQNLDIENCLFLNDNVVSSLAEVNSLQQLTITQCKNITNNGLIKFLKLLVLKPYQELETLNLNNFSASLTTSMVRLMVKIKSLRKLRIANDESIDTEIVNYLIEQAPESTLTTLEILNCLLIDGTASWSDCAGRLKKKGITLRIE